MLVKFAVEVKGVDPREEEVVGEVEVGGAPSLAPVAEAVEEVEVGAPRAGEQTPGRGARRRKEPPARRRSDT